jgi:putative PEP-CTERM system TPR-repeat lipoprotein
MPESPVAYNLTGLAFLAEGESDKARGRFQKALELDPEFATAALNLARIEVAADNLDGAQQQYESVLSKKPGHLGAMLGLAALAERREDPDAMVSWLEKAQEANSDSVQPGLLLARHYISKKEALRALAVVNNLARSFPDNAQVLELLARAQSLAGESANAMRTFEQLAQLRPNDPNLHYLLGGGKWKAEDLYGAKDAFRKAISLKPDFINARVALASVELQDGRVGDALTIAKKLQQDFPDAAIGYQLEGRAYLSQDRPEEALTAFETGYSKEKGAEVMRQLANAYAEAGRRADAIELLEDWTAENPKDLGALGMLAMHYQQGGRDSDAIKAYETLVDGGVEDVVVLNNLAWIYHQAGDPRALETAKKAFDLDSDRPEVADTYGWILVQSGKVQEGLPVLQQAYVSYPTQTEIGYHVAVGLSKADRAEEAVKVLRRLLRENPNFPQAEDAKALLSELEKQ